MERVIVSRHSAEIRFIASQLHPYWHPPIITPDRVIWQTIGVEPEENLLDSIPVVGNACASDVVGKTVYGNLPLHLAALAARVVAVEFAGASPRGECYSLADMVTAGARLVEYRVRSAPGSISVVGAM
jgi:hypothetical protein